MRKSGISDKVADQETKELLFEGASISQLARLFGMDNRTVQSKIAIDVQPVGRRMGFPIYSVADAARYLVEHDLDLTQLESVAAYVQKLDPTRLPRQLTKEFWQAMLNKQKYEEQAGDLWRTERTVEVFSDLVKALRMPLLLARDTVGAASALNPRQQQVLTQIIDSLLDDLHAAGVSALNGSLLSGKKEQVVDKDDDEL